MSLKEVIRKFNVLKHYQEITKQEGEGGIKKEVSIGMQVTGLVHDQAG